MRCLNVQEEYGKQVALTGANLLHLTVSMLLFGGFWMLFRYGELFPSADDRFRYNFFIIIGYAVVLFFFNRTYGSYLLGYVRIRGLVFCQCLSQLFSAGGVYFVASLAWNRWNSPLWFLPMLVAQGLMNVGWTSWGTKLFFRLYPTRKTILIYRNQLDKHRFGSIKGKPGEKLYAIADEMEFDGRFSEIRDKLDGYEAVFVAGVNSRCRNGIMKYCKERGIPGFFLPHVGDVIMQESVHIKAFSAPVLFVSRTVMKPEYRVMKRAFDFCFSLLGIIMLSPIMMITAAAIRLYDGGPAIYKQVRLTRDGKKFKIWKFRSMQVDAEKDGVARLSSGENDGRITPIGRIVRKYRLDELPQLFNILTGDMSFVGPRPERPEIAERYCETIPDFKLRLQVKAGLTGYAQVYGKYNTDPYEKLEFDLLYMNSMSILTDIKLMFATFGILFKSESTEGVAAGATTAMDCEKVTDSSNGPSF